MRKTSLAEAKTHLSKIVDDAEHHGVSTLIHRHGKPSAVIVPLAVGAPPKRRKPGMTPEDFKKLCAEMAASGDPDFPAVQDLIDGRR